jgi:hypothetical protein
MIIVNSFLEKGWVHHIFSGYSIKQSIAFQNSQPVGIGLGYVALSARAENGYKPVIT